MAHQAYEDGNFMGVQIGPSHLNSRVSEAHFVVLGTASHREGFPFVSQSFQAWVYLARCLLSRDNRNPCATSSPCIFVESLLRIFSKPRINALSDWLTRLRGFIIRAKFLSVRPHRPRNHPMAPCGLTRLQWPGPFPKDRVGHLPPFHF